MDVGDRQRMIDLWVARIRAESPFQAGYYQGRFEEYAAQNAIDPDDFPALRREATVIADRPSPDRHGA